MMLEYYFVGFICWETNDCEWIMEVCCRVVLLLVRSRVLLVGLGSVYWIILWIAERYTSAKSLPNYLG